MGKRSQNIKKWITTLSLGFVSTITCCCFCGGCGGNIVVPYDDEGSSNYIDKHHNILKWIEMGSVSIKCLPFCCGIGCGCCGEFGPEEGC